MDDLEKISLETYEILCMYNANRNGKSEKWMLEEAAENYVRDKRDRKECDFDDETIQEIVDDVVNEYINA